MENAEFPKLELPSESCSYTFSSVSMLSGFVNTCKQWICEYLDYHSSLKLVKLHQL